MSPFEQKLTGNITHDQAVSLVDINERLHEAAKVKNPRDPKNVAALLQLVEKYSKEFEDDLDEIKLGKKVLFDVFNFENLGIYQIMKVVPIAGGAVIIGRRASDFIIVDNKGKVLSENLREVNNLVSVGDSFVATGKRGSHPSRFHNDFHEDIVIIRKNGEDLRYKNFSGVSVKNVGGHEIIFTDDGYKRNKETVVASLMIDGQEQEWASNYSYFTSFCFYHNQIVCVGSRDKTHFLLIDGV